MPDKNPVQSADRIFQIFEKLAQNGAMTLTEISKTLDLNKTTVFRMLGSLISMEYVRKDIVSGKYELTFKILGIASKLLERIDVLPSAHPFIERLADESHETVHFVQREGINIIYIDKVESNVNSIRMVSRVGLRQPMYCTAVGKAMLAEFSFSEIKEIWDNSKIEKFTDNTITDFNDFITELEHIKKVGYALDNEENEIGVRCIAACVYNYSGKINNAFSISAPVNRMDDSRIEELSKYVLDTKINLSKELGYII